jgi:hypothetical protein
MTIYTSLYHFTLAKTDAKKKKKQHLWGCLKIRYRVPCDALSTRGDAELKASQYGTRYLLSILFLFFKNKTLIQSFHT